MLARESIKSKVVTLKAKIRARGMSMKPTGLSIVGLTGLSVGLLALVTWLYFSQGATGEDIGQSKPAPFIPSEAISPHQAVAFPTDI